MLSRNKPYVFFMWGTLIAILFFAIPSPGDLYDDYEREAHSFSRDFAKEQELMCRSITRHEKDGIAYYDLQLKERHRAIYDHVKQIGLPRVYALCNPDNLPAGFHREKVLWTKDSTDGQPQ